MAEPTLRGVTAEVIACAFEIEAQQYETQYGDANIPAGVLMEAARIARLFGCQYDYLLGEAVSRAERRSPNAE
jgi:hypothetical protein